MSWFFSIILQTHVSTSFHDAFIERWGEVGKRRVNEKAVKIVVAKVRISIALTELDALQQQAHAPGVNEYRKNHLPR